MNYPGKLFFPVILLILSSFKILAQTDLYSAGKERERLSRYRLAIGYCRIVPEESGFDFKHYFLNLSYRTSGFSASSHSISVSGFLEGGVNALIMSEIDHNGFGTYFTPYGKLGPEINLTGNTFLSGSIGLVLITYGYYFGPVPFVGINAFYLLKLNNDLFLEIETGFHTTFPNVDKLPYLMYLNLGLSLK